MERLVTDPLAAYMKQQGYSVFAKQVNTVFFIDEAAAGSAQS